MSKSQRDLEQARSTKLKLILFSKGRAEAKASTATQRQDFSQVLVAMVLLDVMTVILMTVLMQSLLPHISPLLILLNASIFLFIAYALNLYNAYDSYYTTGKMLIVAITFIGLQALYLSYQGAPIYSFLISLGGDMVLLMILTCIHHHLTRPYAEPVQGSVYCTLEQKLKRVMDIIFALSGLVAGFPIIALCSILIWLEDRGPVFFHQGRIGQHEKPFLMWKLRSMKMNAEHLLYPLKKQANNEEAPVLFKALNDPRITVTGKIIRKLSVDELPQLWQVFTGEMSLVGPRPPLPNEYKQMTLVHRKKFKAKPGITGLWQITGRIRNERSFDHVAHYDNHYIENWCFINDVIIVLKTIPVVLLQKGAY